ncbi:hypothetical protein OHA21_36490 [Actinoplanes sp. NBC_00393]|uniref:hypothetical protein n=1 Tax=Actinoplanes sp. NBC_00393 TaxID=2975953 RepID=UPI002E242EE3
MRKLWSAGAIACGLLLLGAAPARADQLPNPSAVDGPLTALGHALEPTNDWRLSSPVASDPLSGEPLVTFQPGDRQLLAVQPGTGNGLTEAVPGQQQGRRTGKPADRRRLAPAADVISRTVPAPQDEPSGPLGGLPIQGIPMPLAGQDMKLANVPVDQIAGGTVFGGLTPAGTPTAAGTDTRTPAADERPTARAERQSADFPLLGGLDGTTTVDDLQQQIVDFRSDVAGLPLGGAPVRVNPADNTRPADDARPADDTRPARDARSARDARPVSPARDARPVDPALDARPTQSASATKAPADTDAPATAEVDDPRLHEEPVEGFGGQ